MHQLSSSHDTSVISVSRAHLQVQAIAALRKGNIELVTAPVEVMTLEFASPQQLEAEPKTEAQLCMASEGPLDGVLMWWELDMNPSGSIQISTSPLLQSSDPPRAHWQQGASVFRQRNVYSEGTVVALSTCVQGWDIYFCEGEGALSAETVDPLAFPSLPRHHLLRMADSRHLAQLQADVEAALSGCEGVVLCVTDGLTAAVAATTAASSMEVLVLASTEAAAATLRCCVSDSAERVSVVCHHGDIAAAAQTALAGRSVAVVLAEPCCVGARRSYVKHSAEETIGAAQARIRTPMHQQVGAPLTRPL